MYIPLDVKLTWDQLMVTLINILVISLYTDQTRNHPSSYLRLISTMNSDNNNDNHGERTMIEQLTSNVNLSKHRGV
jgi:hypothetical protein